MSTPPRAGSGWPRADRVGTALVVYGLRQYPLRTTVRDHLYSYGRWSRLNCAYINLQMRRPERLLRTLHPDVIVFDTTFLSSRWHVPLFERLLERAAKLRDYPAIKVAVPQDEMLRPDLLCRFVNEFRIDHVLTTLPLDGVRHLYRTVDHARVGFTQVLTGYLERETTARIAAIVERSPERSIDIGYRAWEGQAWLGRLGYTKGELARVFIEAARDTRLRVDISTRAQETFLGDRWYEFLARCKYVIGVEGGASLFDWDGSLRDKITAYVEANPAATFDDVERHCFPGQDDSLGLRVISPRHLEACAARTCQVLVEGTYNGVLRPGEHYVPLRRDFGNLDEVIHTVESDYARSELTDAAHRDIVQSGNYGYDQFVARFDEIACRPARLMPLRQKQAAALVMANAQDRASRLDVAQRVHWTSVAERLYRTLTPRLPDPFGSALRGARDRHFDAQPRA